MRQNENFLNKGLMIQINSHKKNLIYLKKGVDMPPFYVIVTVLLS